MINPVHIIIGHFNKLLGRNRELRDFRVELGCKNCAIAHNEFHQFTGTCQKDEGGCGCDGSAKASLNMKSVKCPQGVWANRWLKFDALIKINNEKNFTPRRPLEPGVLLQLNQHNEVEEVPQ